MLLFHPSHLFLTLKLLFFMLHMMGIVWGMSHFIQKRYPFPIFTIAFSPFFLIYKLGTALGKGSLLDEAYTVLVLLSCLTIAIFFFRKKQRLSTSLTLLKRSLRQHQLIIIFLAGIFTFFFIRGLYLEYPGDGIEYFIRIGQANQDSPSNIQSLWRYTSSDTFFSSWQSWLVGTEYTMRFNLRPVAALSACFLAIASYRLTLWSTRHTMSAVLSVLLFLGFYGNLQISFFLYKILQGATLAMIVYLEVIPIVYELLQASKFKRYFTHQRLLDISFLVTALWICRDCHQEKVLYIFAIVLSYTFLSIVKAIAERERPIMLSIVVFSLTLVPLLVITLTKAAPKSVDPFLVKQWFAIGNYALFSYWPTAPNSGVLLLDMVVIGLAIIVLSCYKQASKEFFMAAIAIAAFLLFLNPIFATALLKFTHGINIYRVMIAGLPWTFLPLACHALKRDKFINLHYLPIVFICFGFLAYSPMYGKFSHMLTAVPPYADGRDLMPIVQHLLAEADHANQPPLNVMAPPYAGSYLAAWPNLKSAASNRWIDNRIFSARAELSYLYGSEITDSEITEKLTSGNYDVIILDRRDGLTYQSWLGRMTQHWAPDLIASQQALLAGQSLRRYLENQPQPVFEKTLEQDGFEVYQRRAG